MEVLIIVIASKQKAIEMALAPLVLDHKLDFLGTQLGEFHLVGPLIVHADCELLFVVYKNYVDVVVVRTSIYVHFDHLITASFMEIIDGIALIFPNFF